MTKKGETMLGEVRQAIEEKKSERARLEKVNGSRAEAIQSLDDWIQRQQRRFADKADNAAASFLRLEASAELGLLQPGRGGERGWDEALCTLMPDAVRERLIRAIDEQLGDEVPPSREERDARLAEIDRELLELEREEEALLHKVPGAQRREDADPRAFLGLDEPPAPPAALEEPDESAPDRNAPAVQSHKRGETI